MIDDKDVEKKPRRDSQRRSGEAARGLEAKVGAFVLLALAGGLTAIFFLGQKKHVFEHRVRLYAIFDNVQGLSEGAPVRLSGVNVGKVTHVGFERKSEKTTVRVDLQISGSALELVRKDSVATVGAQGLLGDKVVDLEAGSPNAEALSPGSRIDSNEPADVSHLIQRAGEILTSVQRVAEQAVAVLGAIADPKSIADIRGILASLHALLRSAEGGNGLAHAVFYDKTTARGLTDLIAKLDRLSSDVDTGVQRIDRVLAATDAGGDQLINNVSRAAKGVGAAADDVHGSKMIPNMEKASANLVGASTDLAVMLKQTRAGQGTLGALLNDPTVYEQLVQILGGVARSKVLRALVRYVIVKDDDKTTQRIVDVPHPRP